MLSHSLPGDAAAGGAGGSGSAPVEGGAEEVPVRFGSGRADRDLVPGSERGAVEDDGAHGGLAGRDHPMRSRGGIRTTVPGPQATGGRRRG